MRYIAIALNKTGPSSDLCSILSIGAIIEDTETDIDYDQIPKFHAILGHNGLLTISPPFYSRYKKDAEIIEGYMDLKAYGSPAEVNEYVHHHKIVKPSDLSERFHKWVFENYGEKMPDRYNEEKNVPVMINIAGKNFFQTDGKFLSNINNWDNLIKYQAGQLDPSILYHENGDEKLPDLKQCLERADLYDTKEDNSSALVRAWKIVKLIREKI